MVLKNIDIVLGMNRLNKGAFNLPAGQVVRMQNTAFRVPAFFSQIEFGTATGKAEFSDDPLPSEVMHQQLASREGWLTLQTMRSHDQYNTTVYGYDDRYRGIEGEPSDVLTMADHLWLARFLLHREAERFGCRISFDNKPMVGDWNGAGMHTNFSTAEIRSPKTGKAAIDRAVTALERRHAMHIRNYGAGLAERLTGLHETCSIEEFRSGIAHRGASIRIPQPVALKGYGYFEDRRPGANADPYLVGACLVETVCLSETAGGALPEMAVAG